MVRNIIVFLSFIAILTFCFANDNESVLIDTIYAEPAPMSGTIFHNMQTQAFSYFPNYTTLEIRYGRNGFGDPGIVEARSFITFPTQNIPNEYYLFNAEIQLHCLAYMDNSYEDIWPHYYSSPYPVNIDHLQYETIAPAVFDLIPLESNIAVLQNSALIGWVSTNVTGSYLDDIQQSRAFSQYRLRFPAGYDVSGYEVDIVLYGRLSSGAPRLVITYHKTVSNTDPVLPIPHDLIRKIYPQPAKNFFNLEFTEKVNHDVELSLYNLMGSLVHNEKGIAKQNGITRISVQDYPSGIYFLKVKDGHLTQLKKITILK